MRAGLIPYLDAAGTAHVYLACELRASAPLAQRLSPGATTLPEALAALRVPGRRLVVILDQLELALGSGGDGPLVLDALLGAPAGAEVAVVLGVRADFVARLLASTAALADGAPQVRLRPLDLDGARAALVEPLAEHDMTFRPELLERLLGDLVRAGRELGRDPGSRRATASRPGADPPARRG